MVEEAPAQGATPLRLNGKALFFQVVQDMVLGASPLIWVLVAVDGSS